MTETQTVEIGIEDLVIDWHAVMQNVTQRVNRALYNNQSVVIQVPDYLYDALLRGWACTYLVSRHYRRPRWIDRVLRRFNLAFIERGAATSVIGQEVIMNVSDTATEQLYRNMVERKSLIVNGRYIPVLRQ